MSTTASDLWLGVPDSVIEAGSTTTASLYENRIGGQPVWMFAPNKTTACCPICNSADHVALLSQTLAPLGCFDRILYTFICRKCATDLTVAANAAVSSNSNKKGGGAAAAAAGGGKKGGDPSASPVQQVPAQLAAVCGGKSPVFVVRCQNYNPSYEESKKEDEDEDDNMENKPATFKADDDWGDDEDDGAAATKKAPLPAQKPVAASESEQTKKKEVVVVEQKQDPSKIVLPISCAVGTLKRAFPEHSLDIFNAAGDSDNEDFETDSDDDASAPAAASPTLTAAEKAKAKAQLAALREKFPNAEIDEAAFLGEPAKAKTADAKSSAASASAAGGGADEVEDLAQLSLAQLAAMQPDAFPQWETFISEIGSEPRQVIRWQPNGFPVSALELGTLPGSQDKKVQSATAAAIMEQAGRDIKYAAQAYHLLLKTQVPPCERCGAARRFEYQLVSPIHHFLGGSVDELSFATAIVFTCSASCASTSAAPYSREFVLLQNEPVVTNTEELLVAKKSAGGTAAAASKK